MPENTNTLAALAAYRDAVTKHRDAAQRLSEVRQTYLDTSSEVDTLDSKVREAGAALRKAIVAEVAL